MNEHVMISMPIPDFKRIIREALEEHHLQSKNASMANLMPEFLTPKEVCSLLKISMMTLRTWTKSGILKGYHINSRIRYKRSDLLDSHNNLLQLRYKRK